MAADNTANKPTKVFAVETVDMEATIAVAVKIGDKFPAPKVDG